MNEKQNQPTDSELEILQILWEMKEAKVKEVHAILQTEKDVGYTTVLKTMQIMHEKNLVDRRTEGKGHVYHAIVTKKTIQDKYLGKIIEKVYKGSTSNLVMSALGAKFASKKELEEIKEFIRKQENKED